MHRHTGGGTAAIVPVKRNKGNKVEGDRALAGMRALLTYFNHLSAELREQAIAQPECLENASLPPDSPPVEV